jgi:hypothetical protein
LIDDDISGFIATERRTLEQIENGRHAQIVGGNGSRAQSKTARVTLQPAHP